MTIFVFLSLHLQIWESKCFVSQSTEFKEALQTSEVTQTNFLNFLYIQVK